MCSKYFISICVGLFLGVSSIAHASDALPKKKQTPQALYVTASEAYAAMASEQNYLFLDVRTRAEVDYLGQPTLVDKTVPLIYPDFEHWDEKKRRFAQRLNRDFVAQVRESLASKGLGEDATVYLMCRSGSRSAYAARLLHKAGFKQVYNVIDGYEGDKIAKGENAGKRLLNGWRNAGLPWEYVRDGSKYIGLKED